MNGQMICISCHVFQGSTQPTVTHSLAYFDIFTLVFQAYFLDIAFDFFILTLYYEHRQIEELRDFYNQHWKTHHLDSTVTFYEFALLYIYLSINLSTYPST